MSPIPLLLLGRPDCGLCEELVQDLHAHFGGDRFSVASADVDSRDDWRRRYGLRIPVLLDRYGGVVSAGHLDVPALQELLAGAD